MRGEGDSSEEGGLEAAEPQRKDSGHMMGLMDNLGRGMMVVQCKNQSLGLQIG